MSVVIETLERERKNLVGLIDGRKEDIIDSNKKISKYENDINQCNKKLAEIDEALAKLNGEDYSPPTHSNQF